MRDEICVKNLDQLLTLLGVGKFDIQEAISGLLKKASLEDIQEVVKLLVPLSEGEQKAYLAQIQLITKQPKTVLNALLKEAQDEASFAQLIDWPDRTMERLLSEKYEGGRRLLRGSDSQYWRYNDRHWEAVPEELIKKEILPYARESLSLSGRRSGLSSLITAALNILEGRVYRENDPLHVRNGAVPAVINCLNGELWFDDEGSVYLRPHLPESHLQYCLNVAYDPSATSPMFNEAVLEIFANSPDPNDMFRHFMELAGYICQPWRKLAIIVLLYGGGNNGKSSLVRIIQSVLGNKMVMADRISEIETSAFKIGALDGKLMLLDDDVDEGTCLPDGFLKKISEEKTMTGEHKYKPSFEFTCRVVPVMLANAYPAIKDLTEGIRRRVMVIPFSRRFLSHEVKVGFFDLIWEKEAAGILNQFVAGFQRLKRRGKFQEPQDCTKAKLEWLARSNVLPTFIEEVCKQGEGQKQLLKEFYSAFRQYCSESGIKNIPGRPGVEKRLESLGYEIATLNGDKVVRGLRAYAESVSSPAIDLR